MLISGNVKGRAVFIFGILIVWEQEQCHADTSTPPTPRLGEGREGHLAFPKGSTPGWQFPLQGVGARAPTSCACLEKASALAIMLAVLSSSSPSFCPLSSRAMRARVRSPMTPPAAPRTPSIPPEPGMCWARLREAFPAVASPTAQEKWTEGQGWAPGPALSVLPPRSSGTIPGAGGTSGRFCSATTTSAGQSCAPHSADQKKLPRWRSYGMADKDPPLPPSGQLSLFISHLNLVYCSIPRWQGQEISRMNFCPKTPNKLLTKQ